MRRAVWDLLGEYLLHRGRRLPPLVILAGLGGRLEAAVPVLTVRAAVIADHKHHVTVTAPRLGAHSIGATSLQWAADELRPTRT